MVSSVETSLASILTQGNDDDDPEFDAGEGSKFEPDITLAPVVIEEGDFVAYETADYSCLQITPSLATYKLALYEPLRLIVCTICQVCIIPGKNLMHLIKHLHEQGHVLHRKW
jgi:hypothetical protein